MKTKPPNEMITESAAGNVHLTFYDILMTVTMTVTTHLVSRFLNIYTEMYIHREQWTSTISETKKWGSSSSSSRRRGVKCRERTSGNAAWLLVSVDSDSHSVCSTIIIGRPASAAEHSSDACDDSASTDSKLCCLTCNQFTSTSTQPCWQHHSLSRCTSAALTSSTDDKDTHGQKQLFDWRHTSSEARAAVMNEPSRDCTHTYTHNSQSLDTHMHTPRLIPYVRHNI